MSEQSVILKIENHTARLVLNRPDKHNAFGDETIASLLTKLTEVEQNPSVRVLCLSATGKSFSAGADLSWMKRMASLDYQQNLEDAKQLALLMETLNTLSVPTIVKIQGAAFGGALGLISCCDIAIASDNAKFCLSEVKLGLSPATISPYVLKAMGARRCRRLFLTAELFDAQQAEKWGLVHEVVKQGQLDDAVDKVLRQIISNGPKASIATKKLIRQVSESDLNQDKQHATAEIIASLRVSEEGQEGLSAFFEKRAPSWVDKDFGE
ncbi:hypothetical protein A3715_01660 [Oleiphilus sp. HI0009]|nr:enoyl-CoA hydratase-related protein [Oleiphilus sp. HI0067]KZX77492.1 hypothetical protein A3715_01660 [Oleiphilus sp. HI0009]KZY69064.1 hypothetical protein A3739_01045 [Oleiphilus sp. HI0067]